VIQRNGIITSPNYPSTYDPNSRCLWSIRGPTGHSLNFRFTQFDLPPAANCSSVDFVQIREQNATSGSFQFFNKKIPFIHLKFHFAVRWRSGNVLRQHSAGSGDDVFQRGGCSVPEWKPSVQPAGLPADVQRKCGRLRRRIGRSQWNHPLARIPHGLSARTHLYLEDPWTSWTSHHVNFYGFRAGRGAPHLRQPHGMPRLCLRNASATSISHFLVTK